MFGRKIRLFSLFGFQVSLDASWILIALLVAWSLSANLFPEYYPELSRSTHWIMGVTAALGFFASIIFHEFWHSAVARFYGLPMRGITLFLLGGIAEMGEEPATARSEFFMAFAGPLSSVALGLGLYFGSRVCEGACPDPVTGVLFYLGVINFLLAGFNLLPAFPLDGGRMLRAVLWGIRKDLVWATHIAASIGQGFGIGLMVLGVASLFAGNPLGGVWYFIIGLFLRGASHHSDRRSMVRSALAGEKVSDHMRSELSTVPSSMSLRRLFEEYLYEHHYKLYPVMDDDGRLTGCVTIDRIREIPREQWDGRTVGEIARSCSPQNTVDAGADVLEALARMNSRRFGRLMVVEDGRLVGIIARRDIQGFLASRLGIGSGADAEASIDDV